MMFLTPAELVELTHRSKGAWQARELQKLGIAYRRRSDGTLVVLRSALEPQQNAAPVRQPKLRAG